ITLLIFLLSRRLVSPLEGSGRTSICLTRPRHVQLFVLFFIAQALVILAIGSVFPNYLWRKQSWRSGDWLRFRSLATNVGPDAPLGPNQKILFHVLVSEATVLTYLESHSQQWAKQLQSVGALYLSVGTMRNGAEVERVMSALKVANPHIHLLQLDVPDDEYP